MTGFEIAAIVGAGASAIAGGAGAISAGKMNKRAERYGKEQNELNRKFQAEQAELARNWQEDMYNQYYSPSAMMSQFQKAGINPVLAAGQIDGKGGMSAPSLSGGSSIGMGQQQNPWSSVQTGLTGALDSLRLRNESSKLEYENEVMKQQAEELRTKALLNGENIGLTKKQGEYLLKQGNLIDKQIDKIAKDMDLSDAQIDVLKEQVISLQYDNQIKGYQVSINTAYKELSEKLGTPIPLTEQLVGDIAKAAAQFAGEALGGIFNGLLGKAAKLFTSGKGKGSNPKPLKNPFYSPGD